MNLPEMKKRWRRYRRWLSRMPPFPSPGGLWSCWIRKGEASIGHQWLSTVPRRQAAGEGAATPEMRGSPRTGDGFRGWGSLLVEKEEAAASNKSHQHRAAASGRGREARRGREAEPVICCFIVLVVEKETVAMLAAAVTTVTITAQPRLKPL